jgi:hypothetical protein
LLGLGAYAGIEGRRGWLGRERSRQPQDRTLRKEPTGVPATLGSEPEFEAIAGIGHTTSIAVKSDGSVAWIVNPNEASGHYQVHAADTAGSRMLASGADIDPTSLALAGSTLYWTQGGRPQSALLN